MVRNSLTLTRSVVYSDLNDLNQCRGMVHGYLDPALYIEWPLNDERLVE